MVYRCPPRNHSRFWRPHPAAIFLVATINEGGEEKSTTRCPASPARSVPSASATRASD